MDVWLAAAERQRTHGDLVNLSAASQARERRPGACRGQGGAGQQPAGLHGGPWHSRTPGGHCAGIYAAAWDQRRARRRRHHHRLVGRLFARVPGVFRRWRPGRRHQPGLPVLPKHLVRAGV
ncbi:aminotransferase, classes I and II domain protein [Mycobacterium xenopi 4042]|uniref:Aminotransferase, classes I and II domain protein n=1 Tax=Mycobacterium xenopi 4042 TaxID=1299334 RepID=X7ZVQ6_MYCXE|nr:aminotransferase, classes I and II domain protein [Mycobacterium xenopi 4042]